MFNEIMLRSAVAFTRESFATEGGTAKPKAKLTDVKEEAEGAHTQNLSTVRDTDQNKQIMFSNSLKN